jgi:L-fuconolactonase
VEALLFQLDRNKIDRATIVQFTGSRDNEYILRAVARHPDRLTGAVAVDAARPAAPDELARLAEQGAAGLRIGPDVRSPGADPLMIWRQAAELGLTVTCYGPASSFASPAFRELAGALPRLRIAVEHLGDLRQAGRSLSADTATALYEALKPLPNVWVKFHGLGETSARATQLVDGARYADPSGASLLAAFRILGAGRLLWGSGYPSVSSREGYRNALHDPRALLRDAGAATGEIDRMFHVNAEALFGNH